MSCAISGEFLTDSTSEIWVVDPKTQTLLGESPVDGRALVDITIPDSYFNPSVADCDVVVRAMGLHVVPLEATPDVTPDGLHAELCGDFDVVYSEPCIRKGTLIDALRSLFTRSS